MKKLKQNERGFGAIELILVLVIVIAISGVGLYVFKAKNNITSTYKSVANTSTTNKPKIAKAPDPTTNWTSYSSKLGNFSLRYPSSWVQPTHKELCTAGLFDRSLYLGPDAQSVLSCGSEFFGQISFSSVDGDKRTDYDLGTDYTNNTKKAVTLNGVAGQRISGTAIAKSADNVFAPLEGTIEVYYVFYTNGITYSATYTQAPAGHSPSTNVLNDFDLIMSSTFKFSS